jgi:hypothetical protein
MLFFYNINGQQGPIFYTEELKNLKTAISLEI